MSKRAEQRALEAYPDTKTWVIGISGPVEATPILREKFQEGYEQAEKDTIERVIEWVKHNGHLYANRVKEGDEYVGEFMEEPFVESLRKAMEEEV